MKKYKLTSFLEYLGFCIHKWIEKERHAVIRHYTNGETLRNCLLIIQECEKCGKLKKVHLP